MIDDERDTMLMAYVDGELDAATAAELARALADDPAQAARAEEFRRSRRLLRETFAGLLAAPLPARLEGCVDSKAAEAEVVPLRRRAGLVLSRPLQMLAASLLLVAAVGGFLLGRSGPEAAGGSAGLLSVDPGLRAALERQASGADVELPGVGRLRILASYPVEGDVCRVFNLSAAHGALRALACRGGGAWPVTLAVADRGEAGYVPAADSASSSLDAWLDGMGAQPALTPDAELRLLEQGWAE